MKKKAAAILSRRTAKKRIIIFMSKKVLEMSKDFTKPLRIKKFFIEW